MTPRPPSRLALIEAAFDLEEAAWGLMADTLGALHDAEQAWNAIPSPLPDQAMRGIVRAQLPHRVIGAMLECMPNGGGSA